MSRITTVEGRYRQVHRRPSRSLVLSPGSLDYLLLLARDGTVDTSGAVARVPSYTLNTHATSDLAPSSPHNRFDVVLSYNLLHDLVRTVSSHREPETQTAHVTEADQKRGVRQEDHLEEGMNRIFVTLGILPLHRAVWLFPAATALHFLEEAPGFTKWAQRFASPRYTSSRWARIHAIGLAYTGAFAAVVALFPNRPVVFLFFAFCFSEMAFNAAFHLGATLWFGTYCPGLATALALYPTLFWYVSRVAFQEGLLTLTGSLAAFAIAGPIHALDVATNVFLVKLFRR